MKKFLTILFFALISLALSATSVDLSLTGVTTGTHFYYCSTSVDSVIVYKPAGAGVGDWYNAGVGLVTQDSIIITPTNQGYCFWDDGTMINFTVNFVSISPSEPFASEEIYKCPETSMVILGQTEHQPDFSYLWGADETTQSINLLIPGMVFVTITGACGEVSDMMEVMNWPSPDPDLGADQFLCNGSTATLDPGTFAGYLWTGESTDPTLGVTTTGTYTVTVTDDNGCQETDDVFIEFTTNPGQEIFLVTIDTINGNNMVTWEVNNDALVEARIYRESSTDVYQEVGITAYSAGAWTDDVSSIAHEWKYKMMILDTCNNLSELSNYHQTISTATVSIAGGGYRVEWTPYEIEGQKGVANYHILAVNGLGMYWDAEPIDTVSGSVNAYNLPIVDYSMFVVGAELGSGKSGVSGLALSNLVNNPLLAVPSILAEDVKIYPNPSFGAFTIQGGKGTVEVHNALGQLVISQPIVENESLQINLSVSGTYIVRVIYQETIIINKIIIQ